MSITPEQVLSAQDRQHQAAHDNSPQVRLIAGPGTGKSFAICERVSWLLDSGFSPDRIFVVSFTRASSLDLRRRIYKYCDERNLPDADKVRVSTLHSLALKALSSANLLTYAASPLVMDKWELENIFDAEFSVTSGYRTSVNTGYTPSRCREIRRDYEAFCDTGRWLPQNLIPPDPPITKIERADYQSFHRLRTEIYSCILPGEIVRLCVENIQAGILDPVSVLGVEHLVVDEYQDLNPIDLQFIDELITSGVATFVAGDDDQSIYSFRFATPQGIQSFVDRYPKTGDHELKYCFRCTPKVLEIARTLLNSFLLPNRIPKHIVSLYATAEPPELGVVHRWKFVSAIREARAIAGSCKALIDRDYPPRELVILVSNTLAQLSTLTNALHEEEVEFESPREASFIDNRAGRFTLAILRIVCNTNDYVAHRLLLGSRPNIGPGTCNGIVETVIANNLNFRDIHHNPIPQGIFRGRQLSALDSARDLCGRISGWLPSDTKSQRSDDISQIISTSFSQEEVQDWEGQIGHLHDDMTLEELRDYLWANTDEQKVSLLEAVFERLGISIPKEGFLPPKVRIMTMHGAKGLDGGVVFIPGLMEEIIPGERKRPYPGLVYEAARMLYVSISRGKAACILSFAETRVSRGRFSRQTRSRFVPHLGGRFVKRDAGLDDTEIEHIIRSYNNL